MLVYAEVVRISREKKTVMPCCLDILDILAFDCALLGGKEPSRRLHRVVRGVWVGALRAYCGFKIEQKGQGSIGLEEEGN